MQTGAGVLVFVGVLVCSGVSVAVGRAVEVAVTVGVGDAVATSVGRTVGVGVAVEVEVTVLVGEGDGGTEVAVGGTTAPPQGSDGSQGALPPHPLTIVIASNPMVERTTFFIFVFSSLSFSILEVLYSRAMREFLVYFTFCLSYFNGNVKFIETSQIILQSACHLTFIMGMIQYRNRL